MQAVYAKKALKYMVLPGIGPRLGLLFGSGFGMLAYLIASIYGMARLLPPGHPYLNAQNIGRFGIRHVVAEAANNLVISRRNIDQIIIFAAVLLGILLLVGQFFMLFYLVMVGSASAGIAGPSAVSIFMTDNPSNDIALKMLDRVFGIPGMFNSCISTGAACLDALGQPVTPPPFPWPMHTALQTLFQFYSFAILLVGVLIFLYFVVVVALETAVSGTPFGQRFQNIWVPIRLVVALGLLVPIHYGFNSGQYLALYAAKMGSGLATNAWLQFNTIISGKMGAGGASGVDGMFSNPSGEGKQAMVGLPQPPSIAGLVQSMSIIHTCAYTEWTHLKDRDMKSLGGGYLNAGFTPVQAYLVKNTDSGGGGAQNRKLSETDYIQALEFYRDSDIIIRFGEYNAELYAEEPGNVFPTCGEIRIPITSVAHKTDIDTVGGADFIQRAYFNMIKDEMWYGGGVRGLKAGAIRITEVTNLDSYNKDVRACQGEGVAADFSLEGTRPDCYQSLPGSDWKDKLVVYYQNYINPKIKTAWDSFVKYRQDYEITNEILRYGWGGAAMWYNRIAEVNGSFMTAVLNVPVLNKYPDLMDKVRKLKEKHDAGVDPEEAYTPNLSQDGGGIATKDLLGEQGTGRAKVMGRAYTVWVKNGADQRSEEKSLSASLFRNAVSMILGVEGIFKIREENAHVHPLAQLSMVGKGMVEHTIRNMALSNASAFLGGALFAPTDKSTAKAIIEAMGSLFSSTAFLGMTAGVTLYYILPFLPFIYFFFAVGSWVKSVFEAMVGIPLWALAHLRLDGEGLPGDAASNGYYQILEIGLRPILIVFGLLAAMMIFTAQVRILNYIWDLVTANAAGFSDGSNYSIPIPGSDKTSFKRDVLEQFGYTVIYTVIVYMLANSSFKLIDSIPNEATRWLGGGGSSFAKSDSQQQLAGQLPGYVSSAGMLQGQNVARAVEGLSGGVGQMVHSGGEAAAGLAGRVMN